MTYFTLVLCFFLITSLWRGPFRASILVVVGTTLSHQKMTAGPYRRRLRGASEI